MNPWRQSIQAGFPAAVPVRRDRFYLLEPKTFSFDGTRCHAEPFREPAERFKKLVLFEIKV
jgi:hypothetical protein